MEGSGLVRLRDGGAGFSLPRVGHFREADATGLAQGKDLGLSHGLLCSTSLPVFVSPLAGTAPDSGGSSQPGRTQLSLL